MICHKCDLLSFAALVSEEPKPFITPPALYQEYELPSGHITWFMRRRDTGFVEKTEGRVTTTDLDNTSHTLSLSCRLRRFLDPNIRSMATLVVGLRHE